jgi:molybdate transport system ATP-binding protein
VALARALAREPRVLLLDEPTAALDAQTRTEVRDELAAVLREVALPSLIVTHDFEEAAALAGRIGVIARGRLLQLGTPDELIAAPAEPFVARFTGANLLRGVARPGPDGLTEVVLAGGGVVRSTDVASGEVVAVVHPWEVSIARAAGDDSSLNHIAAPIARLFPLGNRMRVTLGPLTAEITAASAERLGLHVGETAVASFKATGLRLVAAGGADVAADGPIS